MSSHTFSFNSERMKTEDTRDLYYSNLDLYGITALGLKTEA